MAITGRVPLLLLLGVVAVLVRPAGSTVWWWLLVVAVLVGADLLLAVAPRSISIERLPPGRIRAGHPATSMLVIANAGSRAASLLVRDAWQPTAGATGNRHRLRLRGSDRVLLETPLLPTRRGDLSALGVTLRSVGPLGLAARQRTVDAPGAVRVVPPFDSRKHLPSRLARLRDLDGRSAVRVRGQGTEFDSLREYVIGDDVRSIDWRATARAASAASRRAASIAASSRGASPTRAAAVRDVSSTSRTRRSRSGRQVRTTSFIGDCRRAEARQSMDRTSSPST